MEKIRLSNGNEFEVIPMGVMNTPLSRRFKVVSSLGYSDIITQFSDFVNIETIEYVLSDDTVHEAFMDCVGMKSFTYVPLSYEDEEEILHDVYVIELSVDETGRKLIRMEKEIERLTLENEELRNKNDELNEQNEVINGCLFELAEVIYE